MVSTRRFTCNHSERQGPADRQRQQGIGLTTQQRADQAGACTCAGTLSASAGAGDSCLTVAGVRASASLRFLVSSLDIGQRRLVSRAAFS